jgi:putative sterol carrier protein
MPKYEINAPAWEIDEPLDTIEAPTKEKALEKAKDKVHAGIDFDMGYSRVTIYYDEDEISDFESKSIDEALNEALKDARSALMVKEVI